MSKPLLISAFEPFEGRLKNQSMVVLENLQGKMIQKVTLPVEFQKGFDTLKSFCEQNQPSIILCLGEAADAVPRIEHVAINMMHARIPDNSGYQPELEPIIKSGPTSRTTQLDLEDLGNFLSKKGVLYQHSFHAGTYICNDLYYRMLSAFPEQRILFVHVSHREENLQTSIQTVQAILDYFKE